MGSLRVQKIILLFFLPALLIYGIFFVYPFIRTVLYSAFSWTGFNIPKFIGFDNFMHLVKDDLFLMGISRILLWAAMAVVFKVGLGLVLAGMLRKPILGSKFFTSLFFLPYVISAAAICLMFKLIYDLDIGVVNAILRVIGLGGLARPWLGDSNTAMIAVIIVPVWHAIGYFFIILLAAVQDIPQDIYDAATIDGSNGPTTFWNVTIPTIWPVLQICIILAVTTAFKSFDYVFILTGGGPGTSTHVPATYMYQTIFVGMQFGYGMAISISIFAMCLIFTLLFRGFTRLRLDE